MKIFLIIINILPACALIVALFPDHFLSVRERIAGGILGVIGVINIIYFLTT